ncbi:MAG TPA: PadR family transcriptional regulator [Streptosporangiaceae bacterium]|jgi:DNA-binding PadR family transcriptional regulator
MSLRHGLLGLLAEGPGSGYDLTRRFRQTLGPAWPAQHPQIYAELARLSDAGLIEVDSHGPRGRKAYRITDAGLAEVRRWLAEDRVDHTLRIESLLRSVFFWLMSPDDLAAHLDREVCYYEETAELYRQLAAAGDRSGGTDRGGRADSGTDRGGISPPDASSSGGASTGSPQAQSLRVASEAGARLFQALASWADWARTVPPAAAPPARRP